MVEGPPSQTADFVRRPSTTLLTQRGPPPHENVLGMHTLDVVVACGVIS